jgi:hypothetical protein
VWLAGFDRSATIIWVVAVSLVAVIAVLRVAIALILALGPALIAVVPLLTRLILAAALIGVVAAVAILVEETLGLIHKSILPSGRDRHGHYRSGQRTEDEWSHVASILVANPGGNVM